MKRNDTCIDIDVTDRALLSLLAPLPDKCRSLNPFLRCTVGVECEKDIAKRLKRRRADLAVIRTHGLGMHSVTGLAVGGYSIVWLSKDASDPKREWIVGLIADMLKQNDVHGADDVL